MKDAPPFSAFIDYILQGMSKGNQNSVKEFYKILFRKEEKEDDQIHDSQKDSMRVLDMKNLYEKFCYLNGYTEKEIDDPDNINVLRDKGFKIRTRNDGYT